MRISDWSSDVCSSDLEADRNDIRVDLRIAEPARRGHPAPAVDQRQRPAGTEAEQIGELLARPGRIAVSGGLRKGRRDRSDVVERLRRRNIDPKSVVTGKSVSLRVDLGGCRLLK